MCFRSDKIIIIISDVETSIIRVSNKRLLIRWEILTSDNAAIIKLKNYITENKKSAVYIILNHSDPIYQHHHLNIPFMTNTSVLLESLVEEKKLQASAFSDLILLNKNEQHYLSIVAEINLEWINFANSISSQFKGFSLAALEYKQVIDILSLGLESSATKFDLLIMCQPKKQMQIVIYRNGVFLKNNFITLTNDSNLTVYTGYIKHNFDNAVSSLNIKDGDALNGYFIIPNRVKDKLLLHTFTQENIVIISPYEASIILDLDWVIKHDDDSPETIVAHNIINCGKNNHLFNTDYSKQKSRTYFLNCAINFTLAYLMIVFVSLALYMNHQIYSSYLMQREFVEEENIMQGEVNRALQEYNKQKFVNSQYMKRIMEISEDREDNNEVLQYVLSIQKRHRDEILSISYDNKHEIRSISTIGIGLKEKEKAQFKDKISKIYANIYYE